MCTVLPPPGVNPIAVNKYIYKIMQCIVTYTTVVYSWLSEISSERKKCLILDTFHQDTVYLRQQGREDPCLFFET